MKLSLKQKALAQTIGMFALAIVTSVVVTFIIANLSITTLTNILGIAAFVFLGYMFYGITLSRLEHQETLKELNKKD